MAVSSLVIFAANFDIVYAFQRSKLEVKHMRFTQAMLLASSACAHHHIGNLAPEGEPPDYLGGDTSECDAAVRLLGESRWSQRLDLFAHHLKHGLNSSRHNLLTDPVFLACLIGGPLLVFLLVLEGTIPAAIPIQ